MAKTDRSYKAEKHIKTDVPRRQITTLIWVRDIVGHKSACTATQTIFCCLNIEILNLASKAFIYLSSERQWDRSKCLCYFSIKQAEVANMIMYFN